MKNRTYTIWNSNREWPEKEKQIIDQIYILDTDIIVLQKDRDKAFNEQLINEGERLSNGKTNRYTTKRICGI